MLSDCWPMAGSSSQAASKICDTPPAPAIDRLLDVADRKKAAPRLVLATDRRQRPQHAPLGQRRVLKFVDQQMLDRAIQPPRGLPPHRSIGRIGQPPRHVGKGQARPLLLNPPIIGGKTVEQPERGLGLIGNLSDQHAGGVLDQRPIQGDQVGIDRLSVIGARAGENGLGQSLGQKREPVLALAPGDAFGPGVGEAFVARGVGSGELLDRRGDFFDPQPRRPREAMPGRLGRFAIDFIQPLDQPTQLLR